MLDKFESAILENIKSIKSNGMLLQGCYYYKNMVHKHE